MSLSLFGNGLLDQGGLDCRYLITHLKPTTYTPLSLTMIGTPNRGSPFMDWCAVSSGSGGRLEGFFLARKTRTD